MITTVNVAISWNGYAPKLNDQPVEHLSIRDPRVLLGVQQVLAQRPGVTQAPDLVHASNKPCFVVSLSDTDPGNDKPWPVTTLAADLTDPIEIRVVFAADGGWKTVLVDIAVEVI